MLAIHLSKRKKHIWEVLPKKTCPCFCVSRDCSFIIENKCYKLSTLWSLFLVSGPSVCSDFFLLISSDWLQLGNLNPDHTVSLMLEERVARALPLSVSNFIYCLGFFFFFMNFNFSYLRLISSWHSSLTIASKADSDQSSRHEWICWTILNNNKIHMQIIGANSFIVISL